MQAGKKWLLFVVLVGTMLLLDQGSKLYIHTTFALYESRPVLEDFFHITYVRNPGAAFGFLARQSAGFLRFFFPAVTGLAVLILVWYFLRTPPHQRLTLWGLCLILGGAVGNGIDRIWLGKVIDFIDVHWYIYHWPAFNVADSGICIGVGMLLLDAFRPPPAPLPQIGRDDGTS